jgi:hypothetical protein
MAVESLRSRPAGCFVRSQQDDSARQETHDRYRSHHRVVAAGFGLYLLSIWLIEYDQDFQSATATRLPPPLLAGHVVGPPERNFPLTVVIAHGAFAVATVTVMCLTAAGALQP